jgi:hypothetical protein
MDGPYNEELLLDLVDRHRVAPMAARALAGSAGSREFAAALRVRQRRAASRALRHAAATVALIRLFARHGIEVMPLKGAPLSEHLYGDLAMRDVRDADLLIRPDDVREADSLLLANGYTRAWPAAPLVREGRAWVHLLRHGYHFEYAHARTRVAVELHWRFPDWDAPAIERLWRASGIREWQGTPARMLCDDALLLLLLCDHGARHKWVLLKWLADVAILLSRLTDAGPLLRLAAELDLERPLGQAAQLASMVLELPVPQALRAIAAVPECQWLAGEALRAIERIGTGGAVRHPRKKHSLAAGSVLRGATEEGTDEAGMSWRYRRTLRRSRRPALTWLRLADLCEFPLPDPLFWLHYLLRPVLWLRRSMRGARVSASPSSRDPWSGGSAVPLRASVSPPPRA